MFEPGAGDKKTELARPILQKPYRSPEFALTDVVPDDDFRPGFHYVAQNCLETRITSLGLKAGGLVEQLLNLDGLYETGIHINLRGSAAAWARRPSCGARQRSSSCSDDGCRQSAVTFISMKGNSGRPVSNSWSSEALPTSKMLTFL